MITLYATHKGYKNPLTYTLYLKHTLHTLIKVTIPLRKTQIYYLCKYLEKSTVIYVHPPPIQLMNFNEFK